MAGLVGQRCLRARILLCEPALRAQLAGENDGLDAGDARSQELCCPALITVFVRAGVAPCAGSGTSLREVGVAVCRCTKREDLEPVYSNGQILGDEAVAGKFTTMKAGLMIVGQGI